MVGKNSKIGKDRSDTGKKCRCPISGRHCNALWNYKNGKEVDFSCSSVETDHHIIPRSRGGSSRLNNIAKISKKFHRKYHALFGSKTPMEILYFLENYFWKGDKKWIDGYVQNSSEIEFDGLKTPRFVAKKSDAPNMKYSCPISLCSCKVLSMYERKLAERITDKEKFLRLYKDLFSDMGQTEVLAYLETFFWKGQKRWIKRFALTHKISDSDTLLDLSEENEK